LNGLGRKNLMVVGFRFVFLSWAFRLQKTSTKNRSL